MTENLARFLVPPLAGLTLAAAGAPPTLALGAGAAFLSAAVLGRIRVPPHETSAERAPPSGPAGVLASLREGLNAWRDDGAVWTLIWTSAILIPGSFCAVAVGVPSLLSPPNGPRRLLQAPRARTQPPDHSEPGTAA